MRSKILRQNDFSVPDPFELTGEVAASNDPAAWIGIQLPETGTAEEEALKSAPVPNGINLSVSFEVFSAFS